MLTTNDAWKDAMGDAARDARWMVELAWTDSLSERWVSGSTSIFDHRPGVVSVTPSESETDPITREYRPGSFEVAFRPGFLDPIECSTDVPSYGVIGKRVRVYVGARGLVEDYWLLVQTGLVTDYRQTMDGTTTLVVSDAFTSAAKLDVYWTLVERHPVYALSILAALLPGDIIDSTSFEGDDDTTTSHWSITDTPTPVSTEGQAYRIEDVTAAEQAEVGEAGDGRKVDMLSSFNRTLCAMNAVLRANDDGALTLFRCDAAPTAALRHLTQYEIADVAIESTTMHRCNPIVVQSHGATPQWWDDPSCNNIPDEGSRVRGQEYVLSHVTGGSAQEWQSISSSERVDVDLGFVTSAAMMRGLLPVAINDTDTEVLLEDATYLGLSGMRWRNGFKCATWSTLAVSSGTLTITGVSLLYASPDFAVDDEISWWDGTATRYATITSYAAGTITATTSAPDGGAPGGELNYFYISQAELDRIDATRPVYLRLGTEIVEVTAVRPCRTVSLTTYDVQYGLYAGLGIEAPVGLRCTITRGQLGTTAASHAAETIAYDMTIPVRASEDRSERFAHGAARVELTAGLEHADLQIGDVISFDAPRMFHRWVKETVGFDSTCLWEIVRAGVDLDAAQVSMTLVFVGLTP